MGMIAVDGGGRGIAVGIVGSSASLFFPSSSSHSSSCGSRRNYHHFTQQVASRNPLRRHTLSSSRAAAGAPRDDNCSNDHGIIMISSGSERLSQISPKKAILQTVAGAALSFSLLISPPPPLSPAMVAAAAVVMTQVNSLPPATQLPPTPLSSSLPFPTAERCRGGEGGEVIAEEREQAAAVTYKEIVVEAWEVVNESFLDASNRGWSPEKWLEKKNDILNTTIQTRSKAHDTIRELLASLDDPYTRFLTPSEFSKMARYDVTGIGMNIREVPDELGAIKLKVLGIILDGPAHSAGIRQGDEVLSVNGVDVKGKSAFEVSSLLQGPKGTFVTIEVKHGSCGALQSIKVQRQLVARTPVFYRLEKLENGATSIGYVHLKEFNALARKDLVIALKKLQDSSASFFVLDLRNNLGGLVQAGIEVAKLFLNEGETVIHTIGRDSQIEKSIVAEAAPMFDTPVIILMNNRTASASEIVAAALHDHCRAVLVGERTFGKGLIQSVFELHDGSGVAITIGKYTTPNHMDINGNGIEPDFSRLPALNEVARHISQCTMPHKT